VDVKIVSEQLGHASTSFTRDVYQHVTASMREQAADAIQRAFSAQ
jgi:integrase